MLLLVRNYTFVHIRNIFFTIGFHSRHELTMNNISMVLLALMLISTFNSTFFK